MKIKKLDELQYIKRGNIFKHCLFTIVGLLMIYTAMLEFDIIIASHRNALILIIIFIVSLFCIEMIYYEIYPLSEKRQKFLYLFAGLLGLTIIIAMSYELISGETRFMESQMLSDAGAGIIMGVMFLMIPAAYLIRRVHNKSKGESS